MADYIRKVRGKKTPKSAFLVLPYQEGYKEKFSNKILSDNNMTYI